jgi:sugar lactone lactonase YvrE
MKTLTYFSVIILVCFVGWTAFAAAHPATISTFAGEGVMGYEDGLSLEAKFRFPSSTATAQDGTIYISDTKNHRIRAILPDHKVVTIAGTVVDKDNYALPIGGYKDGLAQHAQFNEPKGLAVADDGTLYIVDSANGMIRSLNPSGLVATVATGLNGPSDIVIGKNGELFVSDTLNHRIIKIENGIVSVLAGGGYAKEGEWYVGEYADGFGEKAKFNEPTGLSLGLDGTIYVTDTGNQRIRVISTEGIVTTIAGAGLDKIGGTSYIKGGYRDGDALQAQFNFPTGISIAADQSIYIADTYNHRIRKITTLGLVETVAGTSHHGSRNGTEVIAQFDGPSDVLVLEDQGLLIIDKWNHMIRLMEWYRVPENLELNSELQVILDDQLLTFDVQPKIVNGRTMLPMRQISHVLGYDLTWDPASQVVTFTDQDKTIRLETGNPQVTGDAQIEMDVAPFIESGRTMVPLRFIAEAFSLQVDWLPEHKLVLLRK